jgi:thymidylate synthase (FAD)
MLTLQDNYYKIEDFRLQSKSSKQGSAGHLERYDNDAALMIQDAVINYCATAYHELLQLGVAKEQARTILPLNLENYFYLDRKFISLHKLLEVKNKHEDTQVETMQIAMEMLCELKLRTHGFEHSLKAFHI